MDGAGLDGIPGPGGIGSEKDAYLADLAWDIADGRVTREDISDDALEMLIDLAPRFFADTLEHAYAEKRHQEDQDYQEDIDDQYRSEYAVPGEDV